MRIYKIDKNNKKILVKIPLTQHKGRIRIKQKNSDSSFGIPVATRQTPFNKNMYVEWQISYGIEAKSESKSRKKTKLSSLYKEGGKLLAFKNYNGREMILYELSEFLYYFYIWKVIKQREIDELIDYINDIPENQLIDNIYEIDIELASKEKEINGIKFRESKLKYPYLIYNFTFFVKAEITIREKQKAIGIQPMLYICFPVSCLKDKQGKHILGRPANPKEYAILELNVYHKFIIKDIFKIFSILSKAHKYDVLQILNLIRNEK